MSCNAGVGRGVCGRMDSMAACDSFLLRAPTRHAAAASAFTLSTGLESRHGCLPFLCFALCFIPPLFTRCANYPRVTARNRFVCWLTSRHIILPPAHA